MTETEFKSPRCEQCGSPESKWRNDYAISRCDTCHVGVRLVLERLAKQHRVGSDRCYVCGPSLCLHRKE